MRYHAYLHDTQQRLTLVASGPKKFVTDSMVNYLSHNEPDSEAQVVIAMVIDSIDAGDFLMRHL